MYIKYIIVDKELKTNQKVPVKKLPVATLKPKKTTVAMVIGLYQKENKLLKDKIEQLEAKIDKLIYDKEQMLRDERNKIETIYTDRDKQLKKVLELINTKIMLENTVHDVQTCEIVNEKREIEIKLIELKKHLKTLDITSHQRKTIKERFLKVYDSDIRIIQQNGKLYLDFSKYDYSDLLKH